MITIGLNYGLLFPAFFLPQTSLLNQLLVFYLARMGVYSPVLAGVIVMTIINSARQKIPFRRRMMVFVPVWVIALVIHAADVSRTAPPETSVLFLALISMPVALLPAFIISLAVGGATAVRQMLRTLLKPRGKFYFYLIALFTFPVVHFIGIVITNVMFGERWIPPVNFGSSLLVDTGIVFLAVLFFSGGINEESGWRGFAQAGLQKRYSPLMANIILWFFLVLWHIPNDIVQYREGGYVLVRIALYPFITIIFGWIYNRTEGSILAPAVFHASMNSMNVLGEILPMTTAGNILLVGLAIVVIIADRMWVRLPEKHPAVIQFQSQFQSND